MAELKLFQWDSSVYPYAVSLSQKEQGKYRSILKVKEQGASPSRKLHSTFERKSKEYEKILKHIRHIEYTLEFINADSRQYHVAGHIHTILYDLKRDLESSFSVGHMRKKT